MKKDSAVTKHYNQSYFNQYQVEQGRLAVSLNLFLFTPFVKSSDRVIDFGCGGGFILSSLKVKDKIGIEINPTARKTAQQNKLKVYKSISSIKNNWADVIISHHALEHTTSPYQILVGLSKKLKKHGRIIFVVPQEVSVSWKHNDVNQHLYTWCPMNLGNLFHAVGFKIERVEVINHRWPPGIKTMVKYLPMILIRPICIFYSLIRRDVRQIRIVAIKS